MATAGTSKLTRRGDDRRESSISPADVGTALREARERLGVSLGEVRDRTGIPWQHLEALEAMDLARVPDQRTVVTAARRYSEVVGLDPSEVCGIALSVWQDVHWTQTAQAGPPLPGAASDSSPGSAPAGALAVSAADATSQAPATKGRSRRRQSPDSPNGAGTSRRSGGARAGKSATNAPGPGDSRGQQAPLGTSESSIRSGIKSLTQTAEVPGIARGEGLAGHFADTGTISVTSRFGRGARPAPRWLRVSVAIAAVLLAITGAASILHHYKPQWFREAHLTRGSASIPPPTASPGPRSTSGASSSHGSGRSSTPLVVTQPSSSTDSANVTVRSRNYQVVLLAENPCWVDATVPSSSTPVYENVLQPSQSQVLTPADGQISIQLGASGVLVGVQIGGKTVRGWIFAPSNAPFTLSFSPAPGF